MQLPAIFRTTPFRLTLLFLALFAAAASAFLAYIYLSTAGEVTARADREIARELRSLEGVWRQGGRDALNMALIERATGERPFIYLLMDPLGNRISGAIERSPVENFQPTDDDASATFRTTAIDADGGEVSRPARGQQHRLPSGDILFVGADVGEAEAYVVKIVRAIWGAGVLVILLGLVGGVLVSRNVNRRIAALNQVIAAGRAGDLNARAPVRGVRDEYDELATGLNEMLDRLAASMGGLRHAGDAIAHDLRSPLTRLRARLEAALIEADDAAAPALERALEDADGVLKTFNTVMAIARLQSAGRAPHPEPFDPAGLAEDMAELYEPLCEDKGLEFAFEATPGLTLRANREFMAQALSNLLDNAVKYTPEGGAVVLRTRRRSSGEIEFSVTDTGPGVPEADRARIAQRFVRLENSRSLPGAGLGLSMVQAVAEAHGGRLEIDEGPGSLDESGGPGLRTALVLPAG